MDGLFPDGNESLSGADPPSTPWMKNFNFINIPYFLSQEIIFTRACVMKVGFES
jgi:hypothetical protein